MHLECNVCFLAGIAALHCTAVPCSVHLEALCILLTTRCGCACKCYWFVCASIFLAICGPICIHMPLCKIKEWATWAHNNIPMMHHAALYCTSFTKLALWNGGPLFTVTADVFQPSAQCFIECNSTSRPGNILYLNCLNIWRLFFLFLI